ncbi:hypothetical protein AAH042_21905 [Bacteroides thetaiotaomicron]
MAYSPGRPIMTWLATILSAGLRICGGAFSGYCACLFLTSSASGLTCCPSFSFSATSGVENIKSLDPLL